MEKKDKHCQPTNPDDEQQGSFWDHVLFDPCSRLIVTLVIGRRTEETVYQAFTDFYQRTDGQLPALFTTDEYAAYLAAILDSYSVPKEALELTDEQKAEFGWDELPSVYFPVEIGYATVQKVRQKGRGVEVKKRVRAVRARFFFAQFVKLHGAVERVRQQGKQLWASDVRIAAPFDQRPAGHRYLGSRNRVHLRKVGAEPRRASLHSSAEAWGIA